MKCHKTLLSVCFVIMTLWPGCFSDPMMLNETTYLDLPPLFHLDEWSQCRRPNDVYCIVDAALVSSSPSPLFDYIKAYSSKTQKHYNRTMVHRGVCISKCGVGGPDTRSDAAERCLNNSLAEYGLQAKVLTLHFCKTPETVYRSPSTGSFNIVVLSVLVITSLATGLHIFGGRCARFAENKFLLAFSLKQNWQILKRIRSESHTDYRTKDLACLEGLRFLGTIGVIFTHVTLIFVFSYIDNPEFIEHMFEQLGGKAAFNTPLWMQVFFSISGFLTTYFVLIYSESGSFTFIKCLLSCANRYIRLTPVALFALWFTITWYPHLGSGPQWVWLIEREAHDCSERWWYHALYIHNYIPLGKFCMGHTWYLAADMQLHVIGLLLLFIFVKCRRAVKPVVFVLIVGSIIATGLTAYFLNLTPIITAQSPEIVSSMFKGSRIMKILYLPVWMNLSGYLFGLATAFIYYHNQTVGYKLSEAKWFKLLFHASLSVAGAMSLAGVVFLGETAPPQWLAAVYSSLDRVIIALCFNVFLLGCLNNCKSILRDILAWRGFQVVGRLTYAVFIVHFIIMRMTVACNTQIGHVSVYSMISLFVVGTVLSYLVAIPVYLFIELPSIQLWKALIGLNGSNKVEPETSQPEPSKIDLVTSTQRNNIQGVA
ncbi:nose resistant to fluoxetine protein 6-like [Vanessa tameamea]|uniref:Nose resistant to fluoxetine protein 6-like n=1 Tax=Vanessa tameamea TaxID=334116 RepID=A0ABM4AR75_VANTA